MSRPIPTPEIRESDLWAALKPLLDLVGTTPMHMFDGPGLTIRRDPGTMRVQVAFQHAVDPTHRGVVAWPVVPVGDDPDTAELAYDVVIEAVPTLGAPDPIQALWPGQRPTSARAGQERAR